MVAGNDTQCCMPFGDGKNTLYTYNPICALFTIQKENQGKEFKTIAQSVLTKDKDVNININELEEHFTSTEENQLNLHELIDKNIIGKNKSFIACDSVEIANNYRNNKNAKILDDLYKNFFLEYINRYKEKGNFNTQKVILGNCIYNLNSTVKEKNTYLPESPVAYSDKYSRSINALYLDKNNEDFYLNKDAKVISKPEKKDIPLHNSNIEYLNFQDSLQSTFIESKTYKGSTIKEGISSMENSLIAKDINNTAKDRPNLSLKYIDSNGNMQAYLVAYEGSKHKSNNYIEDDYNFDDFDDGYVYYDDFDDEFISEDEEDITDTEKIDEQNNNEDKQSVIYVMDLAKLPESRKGIGEELIVEFLRLYFEEYIKKDNLIPIIAEAREVSSYKLIKRHLNEWEVKLVLILN